jgi:hypothetical protein
MSQYPGSSRQHIKAMINEALLPPEAVFSREVYKRIRPSIPRHIWPSEYVRATFVPMADGLALNATFDDLPPAYGAVAAGLVLQGGVDLVLASPAAAAAVSVFRIRRWRDTFLYALVPLLFAIPLMNALASVAMQVSLVLFVVDLVALLATHAGLTSRRAGLFGARFVAHIPTPGLRLHIAAATAPAKQS